MTTVRPPGVSLCDLMLNGLLSEEDILPGGQVDEQVRIRAEILYTNSMIPSLSRNSLSQHPPPLRPQNRLPHRPRITTRPQTSRITPRAPQTTARAHTTRPQTSRITPRAPQTTAFTHTTRFRRNWVRQPVRPRTIQSITNITELPQTLGDKACCICRDREKTHAPYPCFHMCVCQECSELISTCPLCRSPIGSVHRIFT